MQNVYMHKQKKILVELLHGLGDTVCAIPMLKVLREHYQEARIDVVCKIWLLLCTYGHIKCFALKLLVRIAFGWTILGWIIPVIWH